MKIWNVFFLWIYKNNYDRYKILPQFLIKILFIYDLEFYKLKKS